MTGNRRASSARGAGHQMGQLTLMANESSTRVSARNRGVVRPDWMGHCGACSHGGNSWRRRSMVRTPGRADQSIRALVLNSEPSARRSVIHSWVSDSSLWVGRRAQAHARKKEKALEARNSAVIDQM